MLPEFQSNFCKEFVAGLLQCRDLRGSKRKQRLFLHTILVSNAGLIQISDT